MLGRRRRYQVGSFPESYGIKCLLYIFKLAVTGLGGHASALAMDWFGKERLAKTPFTNMTVNGAAVAAIQNVENFSLREPIPKIVIHVTNQFDTHFRRVYQSGHEVVFIFHFISRPVLNILFILSLHFQPQAAFAIFKQIVLGEQLHSVVGNL